VNKIPAGATRRECHRQGSVRGMGVFFGLVSIQNFVCVPWHVKKRNLNWRSARAGQDVTSVTESLFFPSKRFILFAT